MKNVSVALDGAQAPLQADPHIRAARQAASGGVQLLRGRDAVAGMHEMLVELCQRCGQAGAMDCLEYLLCMPAAMEKIPTLALVGLDPHIKAADATANDVDGAVLLYEYRVAGLGTKVFATDDTAGQRTVIAPLIQRVQVAEAACRSLIAQGALTAMISLDVMRPGPPDPRAQSSASGRGGTRWMARRMRTVPLYLALAQSHEATLATLGRHTRRNLRYYRRRLETELGAVFVPRVEMRLDEFLRFNRSSMNPVSDELAAWRYGAIQRIQGALFAGVRARDGRWLSLIGGRRQLQMTEIDWQMNLAGLPRYSLSTVMRSYLLQREIGLGTKTLAFTGGTPHSMRHSFVPVQVMDVIAQRRGWAAWLLRRYSRWIFPRRNFLGQALRDEQLRWVLE